jgi:dTDP-4-amino-4,6-dideoxygalactose transaminase
MVARDEDCLSSEGDAEHDQFVDVAMSKERQLDFMPLTIPDIGESEIAEVVAVLRSGWLTSGPRTEQFECEFREYTSAAYALAVSSCTAGLHVALAALGIGPGDEVITTPLTFCATINVILETGATPVLADISEDFTIDSAAVARAITRRTRAILPVHMAGLACDMKAIWQLARIHNLRVVEDAAHASGASYQKRRIGAGESDAVAFSFYATKNLTTGEGGMVTTPSKELERRMRVLCLHGISRDAWDRYTENGNWRYQVTERGFKYNMSDVMAAIGIHQLRKLDRMNARRAAIAARYCMAFDEMEELETPPQGEGHAWHLYILRLNLDLLEINRSMFIEEMQREGVGCSVHFIPIPLHTYYRKVLTMRDPCTRALQEYPRLVSLPLYSRMTDDDVERVIGAVKRVLTQHRKRRLHFSIGGHRPGLQGVRQRVADGSTYRSRRTSNKLD